MILTWENRSTKHLETDSYPRGNLEHDKGDNWDKSPIDVYDVMLTSYNFL